MNNTAAIKRLSDAQRRSMTRAERAMVAGDVATAHQQLTQADRFGDRIQQMQAEDRSYAEGARQSERQAQADAVAMSECMGGSR